MKILQVCAFAAPYEGNFIRLQKALMEQLRAEGNDMLFAFPFTARRLPWATDLEKITKVYYLPLGHAYLVPETYKTLKKIYDENPDITVVHSHFELYDVPVERTAPRDVKVFWHLHDAIEAYNDLKNKVLCKLQYGVFHGRAKLISVSLPHTEYVNRIGFPEDSILFLPNGIDLDRIHNVSEIDIGSKKYDFLLFGWDYSIKGVDLCVKAAIDIGEKYTVAIVGNQDLTEKIRSEIGSIPKNVRIISPVNDVNLLYAQTSCFLHISRFEGQSYALLEAAYAGLDVICSDIKANIFASEFPTVKMVKAGDWKLIASAMRQMATDKSNLVKIEKTRKIIQDKYSLTVWVQNIMELYKNE